MGKLKIAIVLFYGGIVLVYFIQINEFEMQDFLAK